MRSQTRSFAMLTLLTVVPVLLLAGNTSSSGFVYVMTNDPTGNSVIQFKRASDGSLTKVSQVSTNGNGGIGNGVGALDPLGSEDSLALAGGSALVGVNAGSNTLFAISVTGNGLQVLNTLASGGTFPNSVAVADKLVYVLNAHSTPPNISGFKLSSTGLIAIPNSTVDLPGFTANSPNTGADSPHDIRFSPDGSRLLVPEGAGTNSIAIFELDSNGLVTATNSQTSAGANPFGERFARDGALLNAEADTNSVSSYSLSDNTLTVISPAVTNGQAASCWISVTGDGKFAITSNTGAGDLSSYQVSGNGTLNLEDPIAATAAGGNPIDSAFSSDSQFLYVEDSSLARVLIYRVNGASLTLIGTVTGCPPSVSQPTLSHQVLKLEDELGAKLFCRTGRTVLLTRFGQAFLPKAETILLQIREAQQEIQQLSGREAGTITLGVIPSLSPRLLPDLLAGFVQQNPVIEMRVVEESSPTLLKWMHEGNLDLAVMQLPITAEWAHWLELVREKLYVVVGPGHSLAREKELALEKLESAPFLFLKDGYSFRNGALAAFRAANVKPRIVFETGSFMTILRMVKAGMGISVVPEMAVDENSGCKFVPVKANCPFRIIGLVHSKRRPQTRLLKSVSRVRDSFRSNCNL